MKGRRMDRNGNTADNTASSLMYQSVGIGFSQSASGGGGSMQSSPPGAYPSQFLKYDARGAVVPTLYSPPMTSAGFGAYSMLGVAAGKHLPVPVPAHHHPHSHPLLAASLPAPPITCPKLPDMPPSPAYSRTQISPDVNFNTQLFNPASGEKVLALNKSSSKEQDSNSFDVDKVKVKKENIDEAIKEEVDQKDTADSPGKKLTTKDSFACRYCTTDFKSPVELHQHERYLCKSNKDVILRMPNTAEAPATAAAATTPSSSQGDACTSPCSATSSSDVSHQATPNGSLCDTATEDEESEEMDGKKYRMRSLISEDQQSILKTRYRENPRPNKNELVLIATEVGLSKRVVQVWFQNMRARDRRRGKEVPYFPNMARYKLTESGLSTTTTTTTTTASCIPAYIPIVPQIFSSSTINNLVTDAYTPTKFNGCLHRPSPSSQAASGSSEMPLDLSVRKQPPRAHSNSSSPAPSVSPYQFQDQVLNLSTKSPSANATTKEEPTSDTPNTIKQETNSVLSAVDSSIRFQKSFIYKYLKQEGLFKSNLKALKDEGTKKSVSPSDRHQMAMNIRSQLLAMKNSPSKTNGHANEDQDTSIEEQAEGDQRKGAGEENESNQHDDSDVSGESRLVIDEKPVKKEDEDMDNEDEDDDSTDDDDDDEDDNSNCEAESNQAYLSGQHNLETLATVASLEEIKQHGESNGKSKRLRRKSWRQVNVRVFSCFVLFCFLSFHL